MCGADGHLCDTPVDRNCVVCCRWRRRSAARHDSGADQRNRRGSAAKNRAANRRRSHHGSPADCAVDTWAHVVQAMAAKRSPQVTDALANFATDARNRAAREMRAGNTVVAGDLLVFANQATGLLARSADAARTGTPQGSPDNAALTFEPLAAALPPMPHADATPVSPPADTPDRTPAVQPGIAPPQTEVQALVVGFYIARGNQLRAAGNVAAARTYYEYAGNARAAATPARADDPGPGARPEVRVEARHSYRDHLRWQRSHALYGGTKAPVPPAVAPAEIAVP